MKTTNYNRIADSLINEAVAEKVAPSTKMLGERALATKYSSSRVTIRKSLDILEKKGLIARTQQGTFWLEMDDIAKEKQVCQWHIGIVIFNKGVREELLAFISGIENENGKQSNFLFSIWLLDKNGRAEPDEFTQIKQADAYILTGDYRLCNLTWFINQAKPMIVVGDASDTALNTMDISKVGIDTHRGWYLAMEHLIGKGCTKPALLFGSEHQAYKKRHQGVIHALEASGVDKENCKRFVADKNNESGISTTEKLYSAVGEFYDNINKFDCLITTLEHYLVIAEGIRRGINLSEKMLVVVETRQHDKGPLFLGHGSISTDYEMLGKITIKKLIELMNGQSNHSLSMICPELKTGTNGILK